MRLTNSLLLVLLICTGLLAGCGGTVDANVTTQHNNAYRTGAYLAETTLTPKSIHDRGMEEKYRLVPCSSRQTFDDTRPSPDGVTPKSLPTPGARPCLNGPILTQPLYVGNVDFKLTRETANGVFLTTMWDWVYAVNADTGAWEWATDLMRDNSGGYVQQPCRWTDGRCDTGWLARGVNSTAVIDPGANEMYVLFSTRLKLNIPVNCDPSNDLCRYWQHLVEEADINYWLVVLRLNDGVELRRVRVGAQARKSDGSLLSFDDRQELDRPGLLLDHGSIYLAFGANAGIEGRAFYHGWVIRYQAKDLAFQGAFCTSVNSERGSGIWQGGGGLAADATDSGGSVYFLTGNGPANSPSGRPPFVPLHPNPPNSFGDSFIKLTPSGGSLTPTAFVPEGADQLDAGDADLGAGGAMVIPDTDIVIGGGKTGYLYVLDRRSMKLQQWFPASTNQYEPSSRDQDWNVGPHLHGSPTYWRGSDPNFGNLYIWGEKDFLKLYRFDTRTKKFEEKRGTPLVPGSQVLPFRQGSIQALGNTMPGGIMSISANGNTPHTGVLWATLPVFDWPKSGPFPGRLYAFDAENLDWLWDAGWNGGLAHWVPPTVAEGKVFQATSDKLIMYGLCAPEKPCRPSGQPFQPKSVWNIMLTAGPDLGVAHVICKSCHTQSSMLEEIRHPKSMTKIFPNGAAMRAFSAQALEQLAPPDGQWKTLVFKGQGTQIYEAEPSADTRDKFAWRLRGSTADLVEIKTDVPEKENTPVARVRLSEGFVWSASDGSSVVGQIEKSALAPESTDAPWVLFRVIRRNGRGLLSKQNYVQCIYTHAGHAPVAPPKHRGEIARVPYYAQFSFFR